MAQTRRDWMKTGLAGPAAGMGWRAGIDRRARVGRHEVRQAKAEAMEPLSVGNGEFCFTVDVTGLQSYAAQYEAGIPLCTQSQWGWHSVARPAGSEGVELRLAGYDTHGREVGYPTSGAGQTALFNWLRENPHRLHLGRVGLRMKKRDGSGVALGELGGIEQRLDLWRGVIVSRFEVEGVGVKVETACHPGEDMIGVVVESAMVAEGRLAVELEFPYGSPSVGAADWKSGGRHRSELRGGTVERELDGTRYGVAVGGGVVKQEGPHLFVVAPAGKAARWEVSVGFVRPGGKAAKVGGAKVVEASARHWARFWTQGGAVDLDGSADGRARELERRIVLSEYLTAIQCAGSLPPQETGLTCNSWYGKFHLEMHWWHAVHFGYWGRVGMLEKSLGYYGRILERARGWAKRQGYEGARWPKMVGPEGIDSPSSIGPLLIWQQPHPIYYAELARRAGGGAAAEKRYGEVVRATAEFMVSFAWLDEKRGAYVLGPPVIPAQENHPARETWNPTYEIEYWKWALGVAQQWRERAGEAREAKWDDVMRRMSKPAVRDGVYLAHENCPQTFTERNRDHPSMLAALGVLPGAGIDAETMRRTLKKVMAEWRWSDTWGWDYPMTAMTAARLGERETAVAALLLDTPKNRYLRNGHNYQRPGLHLYLPGNGGLLTAVALMAAGWEGGPAASAPGFPEVGWTVRVEGISKVI